MLKDRMIHHQCTSIHDRPHRCRAQGQCYLLVVPKRLAWRGSSSGALSEHTTGIRLLVSRRSSAHRQNPPGQSTRKSVAMASMLRCSVAVDEPC